MDNKNSLIESTGWINKLWEAKGGDTAFRISIRADRYTKHVKGRLNAKHATCFTLIRTKSFEERKNKILGHRDDTCGVVGTHVLCADKSATQGGDN